MHMADALLSPAVGGTMWAATAGLTAYASRKVKQDLHDRSVPLMGVIGAFIFAAQMINFTIPGTGSSGHIAGGMILAILLGPHASFITMASILTVQSLFFADGGLLALGCNIFNLGFFPSYIVYPYIYKKMVRSGAESGKVFAGSIIASITALQRGAFSVVLQTAASGVSQLPLRSFFLLMQPIHLAIGLVEGVVTALLVLFVTRARPELADMQTGRSHAPVSRRTLLITLVLAAAVVGGAFSWYASEKPDGLEWSIQRITGAEELSGTETPVHEAAEDFQQHTSLLPDYQFRELQRNSRSAERAGTTVSGLLGGAIILGLVLAAGLIVKTVRKRRAAHGTSPDSGP